MREVCFSVLLRRDEDDPAVYRASVPGLPGWITTLGPARAALDAAHTALERILPSLSEEEYSTLCREQDAVRPSRLPSGSRLERVCVRRAREAELTHR